MADIANNRPPLTDTLVDAVFKINERFGHTKKDLKMLNAKGSKTKGVEIIDDYIKAAEDHDLSSRDPLTNLHNRRYLIDDLHGEMVRSEKPEFGLALLDIDHFKSINDTFGHKAGDVVLKAVAQVIQNSGRPGDVFVRYGGEEFILKLPRVHTNKDLSDVLERLRHSVSEIKINTIEGFEGCTISVGGTLYRQEDDKNYETTIARADDLMYKAKQAGRNQVMVA